ncbi:hypothetical protein GQX74_007591 [Glossina fuscipes]|nr:hypothetical protein GQX74_007591 [Glossina fuscipes]
MDRRALKVYSRRFLSNFSSPFVFKTCFTYCSLFSLLLPCSFVYWLHFAKQYGEDPKKKVKKSFIRYNNQNPTSYN